MKLVRLENWRCVPYNDGYMAPEVIKMCLVGEAYGHEKHEDGTILTTTYITGSKGMTVQTRSGTFYELATPDPAYLQWCKDNNITIDPEWPVKVGDKETGWYTLEQDLTVGVN
jgi:hypothetical protein